MSDALDQRAAQGRKFGPAAADYEAGRADWPAAAVEIPAAALELTSTATVVDLGAGTGKLTRLLADRFREVIAVEPLAGMREVLAERLPRVRVREGSAERLPLADGTARAVFVADAFHWFDGPAALAEIARVLAPGGGLVLLWNIPAGPWHPPLPEAARMLLREAIARGGEPGGPRVERGEWLDAFTGSRFDDLHHEEIRHELMRERDDVIANALSVSSLAGLPAGEREDLRAALRDALAPGRYRQPLRTDVYWTRLTTGAWCDRCGRAWHEGTHEACKAARIMEPPRFCRHCRRRMMVQVLPGGWRADCVVHGQTQS